MESHTTDSSSSWWFPLGSVLAQVPSSMQAALKESLGVLISYASSHSEAQHALEAEDRSVAISARVLRPLLEQHLQQELSRRDAAAMSATRCVCGGPMHSEGQRQRGWLSLHGPVTLSRRYVVCSTCHIGEYPAQKALGLGEENFTPRLEEVVTQMSTTVPFEMAVKLVDDMLGVEVSVKGAELMTERRAEVFQIQHHATAEKHAAIDEEGHPRIVTLPPDAPAKPPAVAYLEIDGVVPMTREPLPLRELSTADKMKIRRAKKAKARGGRGRRYRIVGREVKNAVLYGAESCAQLSASRGSVLNKRYVSHLGEPKLFFSLVWTEMLRLGFERATTLVVLSDGAEWIRRVRDHFPVDVLFILDLFHVKHRIFEVAHLILGDSTPEARSWAEAQCNRIESGRSDDVIQSLRFAKTRGQAQRDAVDALGHYLRANRDRMDYPAYRARGLRISTALVESANFHVTGARLKLQGMRWSQQGASHMASLRADLFNGSWRQTSILATA